MTPSARPVLYLPQTWPHVSARQLECLFWVQEGKSANDIGGILGISGRTVEGHLRRACTLLGVKTRFQAVLRARDIGLLAPEQP
ncbi:helix-turn-helix transcriptional regulator [Phenylobacterium sp.]|uniref:helix-turn-helix domain-containing protein n=1 Tax=Phenylobacterium sp. TaxID=1871053 RepID=UPI0030F47130